MSSNDGSSSERPSLAASVQTWSGIASVRPDQIRDTPQVAQVLDALAGAETACDLDDHAFAHPECEQVGLRRDQDARPDRVRPVVVVGDPAKRSLDTAGDHRHALERLSTTLRIHVRRAVRT